MWCSDSSISFAWWSLRTCPHFWAFGRSFPSHSLSTFSLWPWVEKLNRTSCTSSLSSSFTSNDCSECLFLAVDGLQCSTLSSKTTHCSISLLAASFCFVLDVQSAKLSFFGIMVASGENKSGDRSHSIFFGFELTIWLRSSPTQVNPSIHPYLYYQYWYCIRHG